MKIDENKTVFVDRFSLYTAIFGIVLSEKIVVKLLWGNIKTLLFF